MAYTGIVTHSGTCPICSKDYSKGELVYCDATKKQGFHLVHVVCWDELRRSRAASPRPKGRASKGEINATERLDPPF